MSRIKISIQYGLDEKDMQKQLGLPIYYRSDKFVHFDDFTEQTIYDITMKEIYSRIDDYKYKYTPQQVYAEVSPQVMSKGENARTIKYKVQNVIENLLFQEIKEELNNSKINTLLK